MKTKHLSHILLTLVLSSQGVMGATPSTDSQFEHKSSLFNDSSISKFLNTASDMTDEEEELMKFLYANMVLPDWADYTPEFYLQNVRSSLRARKEMPWGKTVPQREFIHFVLPVRVNNENFDESRMVFYDELKDRVKDLTMEEAILEVNHWCHEKVTYQPSDSRTSSPLSTVSQAIGRCGEESTFTVAALRSVGIPARQVYTPRWAHTDDNHAWVEAWADGKWYFLGACEPEPILNLAWFNSPASRGMLMTTKVFGDYDGPEEVLERTPTNTIINVTENYAPVRIAEVTVRDAAGKAVENAAVNFSLYNYAEFYPIGRKISDSKGHASLLTGLGDLIVWASDGTNFGVAKIPAASTSPVDIILDKTPGWTGVMEFDIVPPAPSASLPTPTEEQRKENNLRLAREDSIRGAYMATFATDKGAQIVAALLNLDKDSLQDIRVKSRGNVHILTDLLSELPPAQRHKTLRLLSVVSEKDLRDIEPLVLLDHITTPPVDGLPAEIYDKYVMNPRISNEYLTTYKYALVPYFRGKTPEEIIRWCRDSVAVDSDYNQLAIKMAPTSVLRLKRADADSRNIFAVAAMRSAGIPAQINPVTGKTQYYNAEGQWTDFTLTPSEKASATAVPKGKIDLKFTPTGRILDPKYYYQFTISKIDGGLPHLLEFDEGETASSVNSREMEFDKGRYVIVTGQRMADGGVLARAEVFNITDSETTAVPLTIRQDSTEVQVIGSFNSENLYHDLATDTDKSLLSTTGRGYYILGLIQPNHEPTTHTLNDIAAVAAEFEKWGKKLVLLFADKSEAERFDRTRFPGLPSNVVFGTDINSANMKEVMENLNLTSSERPVFIIADTFNRVVFLSQGYTIGLGETIVDTLHRLKE